MRRRRRIFTLVVLMLAVSLSGCTLLDDIFGGLAAVCEQPEFVVTKTADTNDGICTGDDCSLREAVITSNDCPGEQTIRIPAGVYRLTLTGAGEDEARRGDLDLRDDVIVLGDPSRTTPDTGSAEVVEIRGEGSDRIFDIAPARDLDRTSPLNVTMQRVIVREGRAERGAGILNRGNLRLVMVSMMNNQAALPDGVGGEANGGGLYNQDSGQLHFDNVTFHNNQADNGGGLYMQSGSAVGDEIAITENSAGGGGGGIYLRAGSRAELTNVDFIHNQVGGNGGGVFNESEFDGLFLLFEENSAEGQGGGVFNGNSGVALLDNSHFTLNLGGQGGGLFNAGRMEISRSSINQNRAFDHQGGGVANIRSSLTPESAAGPLLTLSNVTVSSNSAGAGGPAGAGIFNLDAGMRVIFSTVAFNEPDGISSHGIGEVSIRSSIVSNHSAINCDGLSGASGGYNVEDADSCSFDAVGDQVNTDPDLYPLFSYATGGPLHAIDLFSPALDAADPDRCLPADQRTVSRPRGDRCDVGAFELDPEDDSLPPREEAAEPTPAPSPTPFEATPLPPLSMNFNADSYSLTEGECTRLRWQVENAETVALDGAVVEALDAHQVCPQSTQSYTLLATNSQEELEEQVTIEVAPAPTEPAAPGQLNIANRVCAGQTYSVTLEWMDTADNEEGYRVYRDGQLIGTLGANATQFTDDPPVGGPYEYGVEAFNEAGASARPTVQEQGCLF